MSSDTKRTALKEDGILIYDLDDLSKESSSVSKQYKDPQYLNVAVHFKKGTSKASFLLPLNNIGAYFAVADGLTYGTVKLFRSSLLSQIAQVNMVTADSVYADFAISVAAADNRYVRTYDGSASGGSEQGNQFMKTDASGHVDPSFFTYESSAKISGIGRYAPTRKLLVGSTFSTDNISKFYSQYTESDKDTFILSDPSKSDPYMMNFASPEIIAQEVLACKTVDMTNISSYKLGTNTYAGADYQSNWAQAYGTDKDYSTFAETTDSTTGATLISGSVGAGGSLTIGHGNITAGEANLLTGFSNRAYQGKGNIMTGLKNVNSSHFGINNGINTTDKKGFSNYVTGRSVNVNQSHSSFLSGYNSTYNNLIATLGLTSNATINSAERCVLLGSSYTLTFGNDAILLLASPTTTLSKVVRTVLTGQHVQSDGGLTDSLAVLNGTNEDKTSIHELDRSVVSVYKLKSTGKISQSILAGSGVTANPSNSDSRGTGDAITKSIMTASDSDLTNVSNTTGAVGTSTLSSVSFSNVSGSNITASNVTSSLIVASGNSASKYCTSAVQASVVVGSGSSNVTAAASMIVASSSTIGNATNAALIVSNSEFKSVANSIIAGYKLTGTDGKGISNSILLASELSVGAVGRSIISVASSTIGTSDGSYVNVSGSTIDKATNSLILGNKIQATEIKDSIINLISDNSDKQTITQSLLIGSFSPKGSIEDSIVMGDSHSVESVKGSLVVGQSNTVSDSKYSFVSGQINKLTGGDRSMMVGGYNTSTSMTNSTVIGYGNTTGAASNTATTTILGNSNSVTSAPSNTYTAVFGKSNALTGADDLIVLGTTNKSTATNLSQSLILGSDNSVSGSGSASVVILGKSNSITCNKKGNYLALGIGLQSHDSYRADNTVLLGMYNSTAVASETDLNAELGTTSYEVSLAVGAGTSSTARQTALYAGYNNSRKTPFVHVPGNMHATNYRSQKTGYAESMYISVVTSGQNNWTNMAPKPCRLLEILVREYKADNVTYKAAVLQLNQTGASCAGYVLADDEFNKPAMIMGHADVDPDVPGVTVQHDESQSKWIIAGTERRNVDLIMMGTVTVEEDGTCVIGGYCCAKNWGENSANSGIVTKADGVNTYDFIVVDKFTVTNSAGKTTKYVRMVLR